MSTQPCKGCGMPIEFIEGPNGKAIPAQRVRTIYARHPTGGALVKAPELEPPAGVDGPLSIYVSHFETCPKASTFSKKSAS